MGAGRTWVKRRKTEGVANEGENLESVLNRFCCLAMAEGQLWAMLAPPENAPAAESGVANPNNDATGLESAASNIEVATVVKDFCEDFLMTVFNEILFVHHSEG